MAAFNLSSMRIKPRLTLVLGLVGILPVAVAGIVLVAQASHQIGNMGEAFAGTREMTILQRLRIVQKGQNRRVESYFTSLQSQLRTLADNRMVVDAMRDLNASFENQVGGLIEQGHSIEGMRHDLLDLYETTVAPRLKDESTEIIDPREIVDQLSDSAVALQFTSMCDHSSSTDFVETALSKTQSRIHETLLAYQEEYGFLDIVLINSESGAVEYSVAKQIDFGTNLLSGPWAGTGLAEAYLKANQQERGGVAFADFTAYTPSYGTPAAFVGVGIWDGAKQVGVLAFEVSMEPICQLMSSRNGLGESGESLLIGSDGLMRSDSFLEPDRLSVANAFRHPEETAHHRFVWAPSRPETMLYAT